MAFVSSTAVWFRAKVQGWAGPGLDIQPQPPSGQRTPHLRCQARFTGSLGSCPGKRKPSLPPRGPRVLAWTALPSSSPTPAEAECPGKPGDLGPGRVPATTPRQVERARAGGTHPHGRVLSGGLRPGTLLGG